MSMRHSTAPVVLALLLGVAAAHPCAAAREVPVEDAAALPACHSESAHEAGGADDGQAPEEALCDKACHAPALVQLGPAGSGIGAAEPLAPSSSAVVPSVSLPALDHVPIV